MLTCDDARATLALDPLSDDLDLHTHLDGCAACSAYRRRSEAIDTLLRPALRWDVPSELTVSLLALAANPAGAFRSRPSRWYVSLVYTLTVAVVALSLVVAWQFLGILAGQLGLADALTEVLSLPGRALQQLTLALPESRYALDLFLRARDQLVWLLLVVILWATFDRWTPRQAVSQQRTT
jgi:hypothetical protein